MKKIFITISTFLLLSLGANVFAEDQLGQKDEVDCSKINGQMYETNDKGEIKYDDSGKPIVRDV